MTRQRIFLSLLVVVLVVGGLLAHGLASAQATNEDRVFQRGAVNRLSGGDYVLMMQVGTDAQRPPYRLWTAPALGDTGSGCCCMAFLPCLMK